jgi:polysaccharide biosynthesis/export protein
MCLQKQERRKLGTMMSTASRLRFTVWSVALATGLALSTFGCFAGDAVQTKVVEAPDLSDPGPYRIGKGDSLDVLVWGHEQLSGRLHVADDGTVTVPLIGQTEAAGLTTAQLQKHLSVKLSRFVHGPNVTVRVATPSSQVFFVLGEVKRAGKYQLTSGEVLSQALAEAGGPTEFANLRKVQIIRHAGDRPLEITINYKMVASDGDLRADVPISRGDTILVP